MPDASRDAFKTRRTLEAGGRRHTYHSLRALEAAGFSGVSRLPVSLRILLENLLRTEDGRKVTAEDIEALANWDAKAAPDREIAFTPARVLLQDFTGVPAVVDLAAMRDAIAAMGGDARKINPLQPVDLVIDHTVQVDRFGTRRGLRRERRASSSSATASATSSCAGAARAFENFRVVPPGTGIVHQVNLEYLARVAFTRERNGESVAFPDTLVGTDSHTTMINGLGVVGWGVGGIEAEAAMLGQPISMLIPQVVGFKLTGRLRAGRDGHRSRADRHADPPRRRASSGKFVEFYGDGLSALSLPDRATIANMAPEYGATIALFPVDDEDPELPALHRPARRTRRSGRGVLQGAGALPRTADSPIPSSPTRSISTSATSSRAWPARSARRTGCRCAMAKRAFRRIARGDARGRQGNAARSAPRRCRRLRCRARTSRSTCAHGAVVIAAITSCTNTSNPSVMIAAGLLARKAVEARPRRAALGEDEPRAGLAGRDRLPEGHRAVRRLDALGFHLVGYGCTTCIGNSGPLPEPIAEAVKEGRLVAASVLSGNRNFEGRINPLVRGNYLASPPLVVAYALAGTMDIDFEQEPLGVDRSGEAGLPARHLALARGGRARRVREGVQSEMFQRIYGDVFRGDETWAKLPVPEGDRYAWDAKSTYVKRPPFFDEMPAEPAPLEDVRGARVLAMLGDSVTTDHISPAGSIAEDSPAGRYLKEHGVERKDFNSYGSRRGNHEVMMRGTFGNVRLRNLLAPGTEGPWTRHLPDGEKMFIYDAAMKYAREGVPLVVLAGKEYGTGSSRDWAAKGTRLLGVRAVIAKSFERIHRSNLIGMGVLPLQFEAGEDRESLGLTGEETFSIEGIAGGIAPSKKLTVRAAGEDGAEKRFTAVARVDTPNEVDYYRHGGILHGDRCSPRVRLLGETAAGQDCLRGPAKEHRHEIRSPDVPDRLRHPAGGARPGRRGAELRIDLVPRAHAHSRLPPHTLAGRRGSSQGVLAHPRSLRGASAPSRARRAASSSPPESAWSIERDPITLAKEVASLDMISGGRFIFGIGGGWNAEEMENHGANFKERWKIVREKIEAMKEIWTKDEAEYHGALRQFRQDLELAEAGPEAAPAHHSGERDQVGPPARGRLRRRLDAHLRDGAGPRGEREGSARAGGKSRAGPGLDFAHDVRRPARCGIIQISGRAGLRTRGSSASFRAVREDPAEARQVRRVRRALRRLGPAGTTTRSSRPSEKEYAVASRPSTIHPSQARAGDSEPMPRVPESIEESGVDAEFLSALALKIAFHELQCTTAKVAEKMCLPLGITDQLMQALRREHLVSLTSQIDEMNHRYQILDRGVERVRRMFEVSGYEGPAPVSLESYTAWMNRQADPSAEVFPDDVQRVLSPLVLPPRCVQALGLSASSRRSLFLTGPPGNGKTSAARLLHELNRGEIWIPHAIEVDGQVIKMYDPHNHHAIDEHDLPAWVDRRWVRIRRPLVIVGGELSIEAMDLIYSPNLRFYEAPFQLKANGGTLLIDDFGRQRVDAERSRQPLDRPPRERRRLPDAGHGQEGRIPLPAVADLLDQPRSRKDSRSGVRAAAGLPRLDAAAYRAGVPGDFHALREAPRLRGEFVGPRSGHDAVQDRGEGSAGQRAAGSHRARPRLETIRAQHRAPGLGTAGASLGELLRRARLGRHRRRLRRNEGITIMNAGGRESRSAPRALLASALLICAAWSFSGCGPEPPGRRPSAGCACTG